ncbi:MAG: hypothetical protein ACXWEY_16395 [Bacteroidia bacterium]
MELLIAILIYIGALSPSTPYTVEQVHSLEIQYKVQIEEIKANGFEDPTTTNGKTVWDHEEL